jgi:hypothetical protein
MTRQKATRAAAAVAAVEKVIRVRRDLVHINDLKPSTARRYRVCGEEEQ